MVVGYMMGFVCISDMLNGDGESTKLLRRGREFECILKVNLIYVWIKKFLDGFCRVLLQRVG